MFVALLVAAVALVCVRLGLWQLSRWHEKQALNRAARAALAAPPLALGAVAPPSDVVSGRRVLVRGRFDETRQVLLAGRERAGEPGVHVVTPLRLEGGAGAVLVDRGWLPAPDGATADPSAHPAPGERAVLGVAMALERGRGGPAAIRTRRDGLGLRTALWLDLDSLASEFPYPLAPYAVVALPGPGAEHAPQPQAPPEANEGMHLSYALQWFAIAIIVVAGSLALAWSRRRRAAAAG